MMNLDKPIMIYDGECLFCRRWIVRWERITGDRVEYKPYQEGLEKFPQLSEKDCAEAVKFVDVDEKVYSAAEAVLKALMYSKRWGWLYGCYRKNGFFARVAEGMYRWVAKNRDRLPF